MGYLQFHLWVLPRSQAVLLEYATMCFSLSVWDLPLHLPYLLSSAQNTPAILLNTLLPPPFLHMTNPYSVAQHSLQEDFPKTSRQVRCPLNVSITPDICPPRAFSSCTMTVCSFSWGHHRMESCPLSYPLLRNDLFIFQRKEICILHQIPSTV